MFEIDSVKEIEKEKEDPIPSSFMFVRYIQKQKCELNFHVLMDPGSKNTYINKKCLPTNVIPSFLSSSHCVATAAGNFIVDRMVVLEDLSFPEFSQSLKIEGHEAFVFNQDNC